MKAPITQAQAWAVIAESAGWNAKELPEPNVPEGDWFVLDCYIKEYAQAYGAACAAHAREMALSDAMQACNGDEQTDFAIKLAAERDALRAELDAIAATEPRAYEVYQKCSTKYSTLTYDTSKVPEVFVGGTVNPLFTRPMPAQDVNAELVAALEKLARLGNGERYGNSDGNMIARDALSKYKGAK